MWVEGGGKKKKAFINTVAGHLKEQKEAQEILLNIFMNAFETKAMI